MAGDHTGKLPRGKQRAAISKMNNAKRSILDVATVCFEEGLDNEAIELRALAKTVDDKTTAVLLQEKVEEEPNAEGEQA